MKGNTIMWIHGWGMASELWKPLNDTYLPDYDHVYADFSECYEASDFLKVIEDQMTQYELAQDKQNESETSNEWMIVGWSMGAMLAIELTVHYITDRVRFSWPIQRVLLTAGTLKFIDQDRTKGWPERVLKRMKQQLTKDRETVLSQFRERVFDKSKLSDKVVYDNSEFTNAGLEAGLDYLMAADLTSDWKILQERKLENALLSYLWIHGDEDDVCPVGAVPKHNFHACKILKDEGHVPFYSAPEQFYQLLREFSKCL
jgi:pimeloyl-ACP methyl ester carboxylesterase